MSITGIYSCPACSNTLTFRSTVTNIITCAHCNAVLEKKENDTLRQRSDLRAITEQYSPVEVGTHGEWAGDRFEIIGRARCLFPEGYVNMWTMCVDNNRLLLLVESFGQVAVYESVQLDKQADYLHLTQLDYGTGVSNLLADQYFTPERRNFCYSIETEGEAWVYGDADNFEYLEMGAWSRDRLALMTTDRTTYTTFSIHNHSWDDLHLTRERVLEYKTVRKEITCEKCTAPLNIYSWPLAQSFGCTSCGALYVYDKGIRKYKDTLPLKTQPAVPLYTLGTIRGVEYRVVGFMEKEDKDGYRWREYTLFNAFHGYSFLSEYNGHWIFLKEKADAPVLADSRSLDFKYEQQLFEIYNTYTFSLVDGMGEFPGDAHNTNGINCKEYIAPPEIWTCEMKGGNCTWFYGTSITPKELSKIFENNITLPQQEGVGAVQSVTGGANKAALKNSMLLIGGLFLALFLLSKLFNREQVVYENSFVLPDSVNIPTVITPRFKLDKWRSNLDFQVSAGVDNSWFEAALTLVNADNGKEYSIQQGVEQYSGYADGEHWSEGDNEGEAIMESVPAGTYFLQIDASRDNATVRNYSLRVTNDVPMWRNFFIFVLLALAPPIILYIRGWYHDSQRWMNSPFYPDNSNDE